MGIALPQLAPASEDRVSGAQVIDGSLKFDSGSSNYLKRTNSSSGDRKTWTLSVWMKRNLSNATFFQSFFINRTNPGYNIRFDRNTSTENYTYFGLGGGALSGSRKFRDTGWFHAVLVYDTTNATEADRVKWYINGQREANWIAATYPSQNTDGEFNRNQEYGIGYYNTNTAWDGSMSQYYFIDGQALTHDSFGFTDPLTNTWRPKKYTGTFTGTNTFYLPMDGNSPIGQDQSGQGNNWTPVNFGGSVALDKATGAKPILNTDGGGNVARPGVFGSEQNVGYAVTVYDDGGGNKYYIDGTKQATLNGLIRGATYTFDTSDSTLGSTHPFRLSATSAHGTEYTDGVVAITGAATTITVPHNAPNSLYYYCTAHSGMGSSITGITTNEKLADPYAWKNVLALPLIDYGAGGTTQDFSNQINAGSTTKASTTTGSTDSTSAQSVFYNRSFVLDGSGDDIRVPDDADFTFGSGDFTLECWAYQTANSSWRSLMMKYDSTESNASWYWALNTGVNNFYFYYSGANSKLMQKTSNTAILLNTWVHFAITRSGNVFRMFENGIQVGTMTESVTNNDGTIRFTVGADGNQNYDFAGYFSDVRIYKGVAKYTSNFVVPATSPDILPDTPSGVSGGSKLTKITDGAVSFDGSGDYLTVPANSDFSFDGDFTIELWMNTSTFSLDTYYRRVVSTGPDSAGAIQLLFLTGSATPKISVRSNAQLINGTIDAATGAWVHVAVARSGSSLKLFVDGVQSGSTATTSTNFANGATNGVTIGRYATVASGHFKGFLSNIRVLKGTALYTANFTPPTRELTNVTNTKLLCCQSNTSAIAAAVSPGTITANGNAAATNFNPFNTDINIVRGQETGYCTWNPLVVTSNNSLSNGNLTASHTASTGWTGGVWSANSATIVANTGVSSGSWYWEVHIDSESSPGYTAVGITTRPVGGPYYVGYADNGIAYTSTYIYQDSAYGSGAGSLPTTASGDTIGVALDMDNGHIWFSKNGSYVYGNPYTRTGSQSSNIIGTMYPAVSQTGSNTGFTAAANFGQKPFKFPPPAGFQPLNAANVRPETVITRPDQYVGVTTYTGNGGTQSIETGHKFDFVWIKTRSGSGNHHIFDVVRGVNKSLHSDTNASTETTTAGLTSFDSNGFSIGNSNNDINGNGITFVSWNWKAGGSKNTFNVDDVGYASAAAAGLTGGTITPTGASVGTKQGFSIIKFTNTTSDSTQSHGLTQKPDFIIWKKTSGTSHWPVYHSSLGATKYTYLNLTNAASTGSEFWNNTEPTSSVVTTKGEPNSMGSAGDTIMYLWHNVPGLQKFGQYEGNTTEGAFVELGFRPAIIWIKAIDQTWYWNVQDAERSPFNPSKGNFLRFDTPATENADSGNNNIDFLSNGFKIRSTTAQSEPTNVNGQTYIYCAWAEAPTFNLYGAQSNAR